MMNCVSKMMNFVFQIMNFAFNMINFGGHIKLTDFGLAKKNVSEKNRPTTFCGTPLYLAPVSFQWKNVDFLLKYVDFLLKYVDFIMKQESIKNMRSQSAIFY